MVKDILREIKTKWFQFVAILIITALGVGFFVGIRVTGHDMRLTADTYMETSNALDLEYRHALGIDDAMLTQLSEIVDDTAVGVYDGYAFTSHEGNESVMRIIQLNPQTEKDILLSDGRLPQKKGEVVVDKILKERLGYAVGDVITIRKNDVFEAQDVEIVGFVTSNLYINLERGSAPIGSGSVLGFAYGYELDTKIDVYTSARFEGIGFENAKGKLESHEKEISEARFNRIVAEDLKKLEAGQKELNANRDLADQEFASAQADLDSAKTSLDEAYVSLNNGLVEMANGLGANLPIGDFDTQLDTLVTFTDNLEKNEVAELERIMTQIGQVMDFIDEKIAVLETQIAETEDPQLQNALNELKVQRDKVVAELEPYKAKYEALKESLVVLRASQVSMRQGIADYKSGLDAYETGVATLEREKTDAYAALDTAQKTIDDGFEKIKTADRGKQYILNREDVMIGYKEFYQDSERIEAIGDVFPLIFFGVAILVTLSTISRMVDESRSQIGVYKALGYSWLRASMKYVAFAGISWILGSALGLAVGFYAIPELIYNAYRIMYQTPPLISGPVWSYAWIPLIISFLSSVGVAMWRSMKVSREGTADLLRPPVPKSGQRIFLERIPFIWERLGFLVKVSMRNLFRNKTRFFMTIIGIGGCAGLLITGFGLKHSIFSVGDKQFQDVVKYDGMIMYEDTLDTKNLDVSESMFAYAAMVSVDKSETQLFVVDDMSHLNDFIRIQGRMDKTPIELNEDSVIITEKLAKLKQLEVGDPFTIKMDDFEYEFTVGGITENYFLHYIYMSDTAFEKVTHKKEDVNVLLFKTQGDHEKLAESALAQDNVFSITFLEDMSESYQSMMGNFDIVIVIVVGAALALELIVLLNLITMNMSERTKELATLKVLGFYPGELASYILRENIVLTLISIVFGLGFGVFLHRFVILSAELDAVMFNRELRPLDMLFAVLITFGFSLVINLVMSRRANKVNMSEALKTFDE